MREGIAEFHEGGFDLVLLNHSIPAESRERFAFLIRVSGSQIPVVCVIDSSANCDSFADATIRDGPDKFLQGMKDLSAKQAGGFAAHAVT